MAIEDFDFGDWRDYAGLGAAVLPTALARGSNPYDSPEMQRTLALQRQRMEQAQPAFDSMVSMAQGMTPARYQGAATGRAMHTAGQRIQPTTRARTPTQPAQGGGGKGVLGTLASVGPTLLKLFSGGKKGPVDPQGAVPAPAPSFEDSYYRGIDHSEYDRKWAESMAPQPAADAFELIPLGNGYYLDQFGNMYDSQGQFVASGMSLSRST
jgi:hypothetical protein